MQNRGIAVLHGVVRNDQRMAFAAFSQREAGDVRCQHIACIHVGSSNSCTTSTHNDASRCHARKTQATNHGSNAQCQNIFLHIKNSN